jgi:hypothetical protein
MIALLLAGTLVFCAGVLAIVFGIPIKEFSFGNTMILCGAVVSSTGLILIGLGILTREVKQLSRRLGSVPRGVEAEVEEIMVAEVPPPAPAMPDTPPRPAPRAPANGDFLFPRDEPASGPALENEFEFPLPERAPFPPRPERAEPAAAEKPRRDFLFSSRRRKEPAPDAAAEAEAAPRTDDDLFEPPWAQSERPAAPEDDLTGEPRHPLRPQRRFTPPSRREEPPRREPQPDVSVVKSGVVDAMAYSLYSDGSIEAQLPEGTVRFESIEELRAHLDRR